MNTDELLTRWTVRVAMAWYVAALALRGGTPAWSRLAWTAGFLTYLGHVACAFGFYHHWCHTEAYTHTARQTAAVVGLDWGAGLYVNYVFTAVWCADVCWWWLSPTSYRVRPRRLEWVVQGFLAFIAFNATVVFATGFSRWFGIAACVLLLAVWMWNRRKANA